jgi:hypothetical protein
MELPTLSHSKKYVVNTLGKAVSVDVDKDEIVLVLRFNSETGTPGYDAMAKKIYVTRPSRNAAPAESQHGSGCRAPSSVPPRRWN